MTTNEAVDINQYLSIFKSRIKYFMIPALVVFVVTILVARLLPNVYESSSTILIEEQQIPPEFVRSTVTGFADQRIQSLTQQILSRTKLWEIIQQLNLFSELREKYTREEIVEKMRNNIKLTMISAEEGSRGGGRSGQASVTIAFSIAYRGQDQGTVQKVDSTLASLYLEQNLKNREAQAQSTTKFLEAELKELQERIKGLGDQITAFKEKNEGLLPEQQPINRSQAEQLEMQIRQVDNNIHSADERRIYLQSQVALVNPSLTGAAGEITPAQRLKILEVQMADLQSKFSEDHPDVQKTRREIAVLKKMVGQSGDIAALRRQKITQLQGQLAEVQGKYSDQHPEVKKLKNEIGRLEQEPTAAIPSKPVTEPDNPAYINLSTQIQAADSDIAALRKQQADMRQREQMYRARLEAAPKVEQEYLALTRDYQNASSKHQEVMNKILEARISEGMEEHQKGEKFTLIDPASLSGTPVSPKRWLIVLVGTFFSIGVGLGTVALAEHLDHSVKNSDDLVRLTGLPVLGSIIRIQTTEDINQARRKRRLIWTVTCFSLAIGLVLFHFFYMDLWVLTAKLLRLKAKYS
jgi:succinoglycan biosynthesis transport protein ExoP